MSSGLFSGFRVLWMPFEVEWSNPRADETFCCAEMRHAITFSCYQHDSPFDCADALVIHNRVFDEYGLIVHDGGASYVLIKRCPWCGTTLPDSQRDRWFDETDQFGEGDGDALPERYLTDAWRKP